MSELKSTNVDNILRGLGNPGRFQILQFLVLSFQYHSLAFNDYMPIFYGLPPEEIRCRESPFQEETPFFRIRSDHRGSDASSLRKLTNRTDVCKEGCPYGYEYIYPGNQWSIVADVSIITLEHRWNKLTWVSVFAEYRPDPQTWFVVCRWI